MTRAHAIRSIVAHLETQFPKHCACCGAVYPNLSQYVHRTTHRGAPMSYDADAQDFRPENPIGVASFANCPCGSTLVLTTEGMDREAHWELLSWLEAETVRTGHAPSSVLAELRDLIDAVVLTLGSDAPTESTPT